MITKALLVLWGFSIAPYCAHIHSAGLQQWQTIERELSGQSMAGAGGIVPPSIGITEQITGVCIFAVFGGGPTFAVMNRSLVFFVGVEGQ